MKHKKFSNWPRLIIEMIILIIMPIPYTEYIVKYEIAGEMGADDRNTQYLSDYISSVMLLRLYFLFKIFLQPQINDLQDFKQLTNYKYPSAWLSFKINLIKKSKRTILLMFIFSVLIFSYLILLFDFENFLQDDDDRADDVVFLAIYQIIITITSVGYGDFTPKSFIGRAIISICAIWGAVMISFIVLVVSNIFQLTE